MKYCKKCGVLYSDLLDACPKCGSMPGSAEEPDDSAPEAPKSTVRRQWIALVIGIPALILILYAAGYMLKSGSLR